MGKKGRFEGEKRKTGEEVKEETRGGGGRVTEDKLMGRRKGGERRGREEGERGRRRREGRRTAELQRTFHIFHWSDLHYVQSFHTEASFCWVLFAEIPSFSITSPTTSFSSSQVSPLKSVFIC